jgi:hypothetical protein
MDEVISVVGRMRDTNTVIASVRQTDGITMIMSGRENVDTIMVIVLESGTIIMILPASDIADMARMVENHEIKIASILGAGVELGIYPMLSVKDHPTTTLSS